MINDFVMKAWRIIIYILWLMAVIVFFKVCWTGEFDKSDIWFMATAAFWLATYCFVKIERHEDKS